MANDDQPDLFGNDAQPELFDEDVGAQGVSSRS